MLICYISAHEAAMKELERIFGEAGGHYDTVCEEVHAPPLPSYHPSTTTPCARRCRAITLNPSPTPNPSPSPNPEPQPQPQP